MEFSMSQRRGTVPRTPIRQVSKNAVGAADNRDVQENSRRRVALSGNGRVVLLGGPFYGYSVSGAAGRLGITRLDSVPSSATVMTKL
jgi:hypothetical protein